MILPTPEPPPTAQQSLASGHATPSSALLVGEVSADQAAARAAGALARPNKASTPAASATGKAMARARRRPLTAASTGSPLFRIRGAPATAEQGPHDDPAEPYKGNRPPRHGATTARRTHVCRRHGAPDELRAERRGAVQDNLRTATGRGDVRGVVAGLERVRPDERIGDRIA